LKSFDWRQRNAQFLCVAPREIVDEVLAKIAALLSIVSEE